MIEKCKPMSETERTRVNAILADIDLNSAPPIEEPARQYYYIKKCREVIKKKSEELGRPLYACSVCMGCQMNARDSEKLLGILEAVGYAATDSETADFVLYNTCTVRDNANQRVYGRLGHLGSMKKSNPHKRIALCGCMMQEQSVIEKLQKSYPFVDLVFGTHNLYKFAELLYAMYGSDRMLIDIWKDTEAIVEQLPVSRKYSYKSGVNIMFGCNNFCTYCIVPYVRGRERSRDAREILREVEQLASDGVKEVMLLGQNVNSYGTGLADGISFAGLLREVEKVEGIERIRFMTSHPKDLSDELIAVMKESGKICRHLHLPLQSGSSRILKAMNRRYDKEHYLELALKIRREIPDIAISTDIIVGFPGETAEDVDDTIDVIRRVAFDNAFTFQYSRRTGTPAAAMEQVPASEVTRQFDRVLLAVQETARERAALLEGQTLPALIEEVNEKDKSFVVGRLSNNTIVHLKGTPDMIGTIRQVKLKECHGFYYMGVIEHG